MPATNNSPNRPNFSYRERLRRQCAWPPGPGTEGCGDSPVTASVPDTRVWKAVMDGLDVRCDDLQRLRRETDYRFYTTTTEDIMAVMTEALDQASSTLPNRSAQLETASPDLVRCTMADGVPEELLFTLEEEGITTHSSPSDSSPSTLSDSSTLTSGGTLVASEELVGDQEAADRWQQDECDSAARSPAMDREIPPAYASSGGGLPESNDGPEDMEGTRGGWRDAICFRQYHRLNHPKMSWRRAHASVRRRRLLRKGRRQGGGSQAWSPRLNVSWTSIEEEMAKQGLLTSPVTLTTLMSPVRSPQTVIATNDARNLGTKLSQTNKQINDKSSLMQETRDGKQKTEQGNGQGEGTGKDDRREGRPQESSKAKNMLRNSVALHTGEKTNTNHGNNTAKRARKSSEGSNSSAGEGEADPKLVSVMEKYVTAKPFVPKEKSATGAAGSTRKREIDISAVKTRTKPSDTGNDTITSRTEDIKSGGNARDERENGRRVAQGSIHGHKKQLAAVPVPSAKTDETFRGEQLPIPVIEQGVVHHRHQSPPTTTGTGQTKEGGTHPSSGTATNITGPGKLAEEALKQSVDRNLKQISSHMAESTNADKNSGPPNQEPSGRVLPGIPNRGGPQDGGDDGRFRYPPPMNANAQPIPHNPRQQHQQQAQNVPFGPEQVLQARQAGAAMGRGAGVPPGIPGPALWNPGPGVAMPIPAFRHQQPRPSGGPPQVPNRMPYHHNMQLANWASAAHFHAAHRLPHPPAQGMPNHPQHPFANGRNPQEQLLMQQQPPPPPPPFANGRQQEKVPMMQSQQPFVNGRQQEQMPMMQPPAQAQRPSVMLEDPCVLYAQPNNFPPNGQNNNMTSGHQPRPPESTNQKHVNNHPPHGHRLDQGQQHQNPRQPFPQGHYQPNNKNHNTNSNVRHDGAP